MTRKDDRKNDLRLTDAKISAIKNYYKKANTDGLTTLKKTRLTTFHTQTQIAGKHSSIKSHQLICKYG